MKARKLLAKALKKYRKAHDLTQEQFAELCEMSSDEISLIECEKTSPYFDNAYKILRAMDIDLEKILDA